jgi:hypothetical protein
VHQNVTTHADEKNLKLDVTQRSDETRAAMVHWFEALQHDEKRNELVGSRLDRVARLQTKEAHIPIFTADGGQILTADGSVLGITYKVFDNEQHGWSVKD